MKKLRPLFSRFTPLIVLLLFVSGIALSQTSTQISGRYSYETVENDPLKARIYTLENGLKVCMTVYKDEPRIQTYIAVRTGSKYDPHDATGLAHYLEHMLFKGTDKYGSKDYQKEKPLVDDVINLYEKYRKTSDKKQRKEIYHKIDSISVLASQYAIANEYDKMISSLGVRGTNAYTWVEQTVYTNNIPSNQLEKWLTIEAERFRNPVMRLFHTELEAVYEEKNINLDNDGNKIWEALFAGLYVNHPYGTQTTIGTIDHLKNPSIVKVLDYYNTYYVPNNMAICLSGDFDMDEAIKMIDEKFKDFKPKPVPEFVPPIESPITKPIIKDVYGPESEEMYIGFRFSGVNTKEADIVNMISKILYNNTAGLIDINLNQNQKVLNAGSFVMDYKDYSTHILYGKPREGQTLEEVRDLVLSQIEEVKKGSFPDWLLEAIINNTKLEEVKSRESNRNRAHAFVDAFVLGVPWQDYIFQTDRLSNITKDEIVVFAKEHYGNNYVVSNKRTGEDKNVNKVEKPGITPVNLNRSEQSEFLKNLVNTKAPEIEPVFVDYTMDIKQGSLKNSIPFYYKENSENNIFYLYYVLDFGTNEDKKLGIASSYLEYLGTSGYTPVQLKEEFFKLGCTFSVSSSSDQTYIYLSGLNENFEKGLELFEEFLADLQPNKGALENLVNDILKVRADDKLSQDKILWDAMYSYGIYGPRSPFTNILSEAELKAVTPQELISIIKKITSYQHLVLYYGPTNPEAIAETLNSRHRTPELLLPIPEQAMFEEQATEENKIYFVNHPDMVQAEIILLSKDGMYDKEKAPIISLFNEYFGSGMSGIVFQELRESKALAYAVFSAFRTPDRKYKSHYILAYIGTQWDKLDEAVKGIKGLLDDMPESEITFNAAKSSLLQQIQTSRTTKTDILFSYLGAKKLGLDHEIRKDVYEKVPGMTLQDVKGFHDTFVKGKKYNILVLGDKEKLDMKVLEKYGNIKTLTLEEVFGY